MIEWGGNFSGDWNNAANWDPTFVPGADDDVIIDASDGIAFEVDLNLSTTINSLTLNSADATLDIEGSRSLTVNNASFIENGTVQLNGNARILGNGTLTNNSVIDVLSTNVQVTAPLVQNGTLNIGSATGGATALLTANSFTNSGTVNLGAANSNSARLVMNVGESFTNAAGGTVNVLAAGSGFVELSGNVVNEGFFDVNTDFEFDGSDATVTNRGSIDIATGTETLIGDSRAITFVQESGTLTIDGAFRTDGDVFKFSGGTIGGTSKPVINGGTLDLNSVAGDVDLIVERTVNLVGDIGTGQTVRIQNDGFSESELTSANGFTNSGTVLFESDPDTTNVRRSRIRVANGTLTNATGGVIEVVENIGQISTPTFDNQGSFDVEQTTNFFIDNLTNSGTFGVSADVDFSKTNMVVENIGSLTVDAGSELLFSAATTTFRQNAGTLQLDGNLKAVGGFEFNGGLISGNNPVIDGGDLTYGPGLTGPATIIARGSVDMDSDIPAGQTLIVQADVRAATLRVNDQFSNSGALRLERSAASTQVARIQAGGGNDEIIIAAGGVLDLQEGSAVQPFSVGKITNSGTLNVNTDVDYSGNRQFTNEGQINVAAGNTLGIINSFGAAQLLHEAGDLNVNGTLNVTGLLKSGGGRFSGAGDVLVNSGDLEIEAGNTTPLEFSIRGFVDVTGDLAFEQTLRVETTGSTQTVLIVQDGFTNSGTISFDALPGSTSSSRLQTGAGPGTFNNAAGGTLDINPAASAFLFSLTTINNDGDILIGREIELPVGDTLNNNGNFVIEAGATLDLAGAGSNRATLNQDAGTLQILGDLTSSGNFEFNSGEIIGSSPVLLGGSLEIAAGNFNTATFDVERSITLNSDLNANQTLNLQPQSTSQLTLSVGNTFVNSGTINLDPADGASGVTAIQPASFNSARITNGGTIRSAAGNGRILAAELNNSGTVSVGGDLNLAGDTTINNMGTVDIQAGGTISLGSTSNLSNPIFNQLAGSTIANEGTFLGDNTTVFNFNGGVTNGSQPVTLKNGDLNIADGNTNAGYFRFESTSNDLNDGLAEGQQIEIGAVANIGATLRVPAGFVNAGHILLDQSTATTGNAVLQVGAAGSDAITNAATGVIRGDGEIRASTLFSAGRIAPGTSPGSLNVDADLVLHSSSVLAIEIGGVSVGSQFDQLVVDHDTTLAGQLELSIIDGFAPTAGDTFEVLTFASVQGDFATVRGTDAGNGAVLEKNLNTEDVTIQVIAPPGLSINDLTIVEGDAGTVNAVFTVSLEANGNPVSVDFVTEDLTATAGEDYLATNGTLNFASNETQKTISVPIVGDTRDEDEETFRVLLSNAVNAAIPDPEGIGTISDGGDPQPAASFTAATSEIGEDGGTLTLTVELDRASGLATSVDFSVTGGSATNGANNSADFNLANGTLNFSPDQTSQTIQIPINNDSVVEGAETIELTLSNAVNSTVGDSGNHTVTINDNDFHPDLLVASSNSSDSANRGSTISVEWTVHNAGQGDAIGSLSDRVYFSTDNVLDDNDTILISRNSSADLPLAAGATYTASQDVKLPDVDPGGYFLIFETDSSNQIVEDSDANNTLAEAIELRAADLVIAAVTTPVAAAAGSSADIDFTTKNTGPGDGDISVNNRIFFSTDNTLDGNDTQLFSGSIEALDAGETASQSPGVVIPEVAPGQYFLIFSADHTNVQFENDESNNLFVQPITVQVPDLIVSSADSAATANIGDEIDVSFRVKNEGDAAAETSRLDRIFLSTDETADAGDLQVFQRSNNGDDALAPNQILDIDGTVNIPSQFAAGDYFLLFVTDDLQREFESDETNNVLSRPLRIEGADLVVDSVAVTAAAEFGDDVEISWTVRNTGTLTVDANVLDQVRLATNEAATQNVTFLLSERAGENIPLAPGETYTQTFTATLPLTSTTTPGSFFIVARTDAASQVVEQSEVNNSSAAPIELILPPLPDIQVTDISVPVDAANSGDLLEVEWTVTNTGTADAVGPWNTSLTLTDADDTVAGRFLGSLNFNGTLTAGESIVRRTVVVIPAEPGFEGPARVIVNVDSSRQVFEHDGDDNNRVLDDDTFELSIREFPNLIVSDIQVPASAVSGEATQIQITVTNTGGAPTSSPQWFDNLFLSADQTFDPQGASEGADSFLAATANVSFLNPGESYTSAVDVVLPDNLDGNFFVFAVTDRPNRVNERNNEGDNVSISEPIQITLPPAADLQVTNINAPLTVFSEEEFLVEWTVTNNGDAATETDVIRDRIFLSPDQTISVNDVLLGSNAIRGTVLEPGESYTESLLVSVPVGLQGLDLFLLVQTDVSDDVFEHANEANNVSSRSVNVFLNPSPDLVVEDVSVPATVRSGTSLDITYTAANRGLGATSATRWVDRIFLSEDNVLSDDDQFLNNVIHTGAVGANSTYTETLTQAIPNTLTGDFFVIVVSDFGNDVFESVFEDNNSLVSEAAVTFQSLPADLVITNVTAPAAATNGEVITIDWTVRNEGIGDTIIDQFIDSIRSTTNDVIGDIDDRQLAQLRHGPRLAPGESVTISQVVQVPDDAQGQLKLFVVADQGGQQVFESDEVNNASELVTINISQQLADLVTDGIDSQTQPPADRNFAEGDLLEVTWTGSNQGTSITNSNVWRDEIFLSLDTVFDRTEDILLGSAFHSGALAPGESYSQTKTFELPNIGGDFRIIIVTDSRQDVLESDELNNVFVGGSEAADLVLIDETPEETRPDMQITNVDAPATAVSGQEMEVAYDVTNTGGDVANGAWFDTIFLSLDEVFDNRDTALRSVFRSGQSIASGDTASFSSTVDLPRGIAGGFFVFVRTNSAVSGTRVQESNLENNFGHDREATTIELLPPADLVVGAIPVPTNATPGQDVSITYTVINEGTDVARGRWSDTLFISSDTTFDSGDFFLGEVPHIGDLAPGESYTETLTIPLPGIDPGEHFVIVRSDIRNQVAEISEANNIRASVDAVDIDVPELQLGVAANGTLTEGDFAYFKVDVAAGETLRISLDSDSPDAFNQLFVSFDKVPQLADFDFNANRDLGPDQEILVPITRAGTYFILAQGVTVNEAAAPAFSIQADVLEFSALSTNVTRGSTLGQVTIPLRGAKLTPITDVILRAEDGSEVVADRVRFVNQSEVWATFDLAGASVGEYDIVVEDGNNVASLDNSFSVTDGPLGELRINIRGPENVGGTARRDPVFTFQVEYENVGDTDVISPILEINMAGAEIQTPGLDGIFRNDQQILAVNREGDGPAGVLAPGASNTLTFVARVGGAAGLIPPTAEEFAAGLRGRGQATSDSVNIETRVISEALLQQLVADDDVRSQVVDRVVESIGETGEELRIALAENATHLSQLGAHVSDVFQLLLFEINHLERTTIVEESVTSVDAVAPSSTLPLFIERAFAPNAARVGGSGLFGQGWTHNWDMGLFEDEGFVTVELVGRTERYRREPDGSFVSSSTDPSTLVREGSRFVHTDQNGTRRIFGPAGEIVRLESPDGSSISVGYENLLMTSLTHSNGAEFTLAYNADGLVETVTDHAERVTTYTYDVSGDHLLQVAGPAGQSAYEYDDADGFSNGLLVMAETSNGIVRRFEYDELGRFAASSKGNVNERTEYAYDDAGGVRVTDADGRSRTILFAENGAIGQVFDDTGDVVNVVFDRNGLVDQTVSDGGLVTDFDRDENGNVTSVVDAAGGATEFSYNSNGQLTQSINAVGVGQTYVYDENGRLSGITYADGSTSVATYNDDGELSTFMGRDNASESFTYNDFGQVERVDYSDGTVVDFTYDVRGNLLTATDESGTTTHFYDSADRLIRVDYPNGRFLTFEFDASGRRTSSTDSTGFITRYEYDTSNRLSAVRKGNGTLVAEYQHDDLGRLVRENSGNGGFTTYSYDNVGRMLTRMNHSPNGSVSSSFEYAYDTLGRQQSVTTLDGTTNYEYDVKGQLVKITLPSASVIEYEYDAAGNRTAVIDNGVRTEYIRNELGLYTQIGSQASTYDDSGRLIRTEDGDSVTIYQYDQRGRLVMTDKDGDVTEFEYDALGRHTGRIQNGQRIEVLTDPFGIGQPVAEFHDDGSVNNRVIFGNGLAGTIDGSGNDHFFEFDGLGNTVKVNDAAGGTLNEYTILPFGEILQSVETVPNRFRLSGQNGAVTGSTGTVSRGTTGFRPAEGRSLTPNFRSPTQPSDALRPQTPGGNNPNVNATASARGFSEVLAQGTAGHPQSPGQAIADPGQALSKALISNFTSSLASDDFATAARGSNADTGIRGFDGTSFESQQSSPNDAGEGSAIERALERAKEKAVDKAVDLAWGAGERVIRKINVIRKAIDLYEKGPVGFVYDEVTGTIQDAIETVKDIALFAEAGGEALGLYFWNLIRSRDPNDITGPAGFGEEHWVTAGERLPFTIRFENVAEATAPAQRVLINSKIDRDIDVRTLRFGDFGFGDFVFNVADGSSSINQRFDFVEDKGILVDVKAAVDPRDQIITWTLTAIDPVTGLPPEDPTLGFLPPNIGEEGIGEGFANYSIVSDFDTPSGTEISSQATIFFDANAPLDTNIFVNTIDSGRPTSEVNPLPELSSELFEVSWTGSDEANGSGIGTYDIFVSQDDGPFEIWLSGTTARSAPFPAELEHTYRFYSVAVDNAGNRELAPVIADAATRATVDVQDGTAPESLPSAERDAVSKSFEVTIMASDPQGPNDERVSGLRRVDVFVAIDEGEFALHTSLQPGETSFVFDGESNRIYWFRTVAIDNAGNVENKAVVPEATVFVGDFDTPTTEVSNLSAAENGQVTLTLTGTDSGGSGLAHFDIFVFIDGSAPTLIATVAAGDPDAAGVHSVTTTFQGLADNVEHTYEFFSVGTDDAGNVEDAPPLADQSLTATFSSSPDIEATGIDVQNGLRQRSFVRFVDLEFVSSDGLQSLIDAGGIRLERFDLNANDVTVGTGEQVGLSSVSFNVVNNTIRIDFGTQGIGGNRNSRAGDGFYRIMLDATGDGAVDQAFEFHRVFGDADGDGDADRRDVLRVLRGFRRRDNPEFDMNGDGRVNFIDVLFTAFEARRGKKLKDDLFAMLDD